MPKQKMMDLLYALMLNCKRSDRELAKLLRVSQPTITRMRKNLEKTELIREYAAIPDLEKLGFEVAAFSFISANNVQEQVPEIQKWISENSEVIFASSGGGLAGKTLLTISIHKDFTDFSAFNNALKSFLGSNASSVESFLFSLQTGVVKHFSFRNLKKV